LSANFSNFVEVEKQKDTYQSLTAPSFGEFKDRGSKFLAYAFPVADTDEIQAAQAEVRKAHAKARHHCYAYRLGMDQYNYRANDDGEPSGTAGRPILGQIDSAGLTNTLVIVVRYFGGTLLGASGLINAYKKSTTLALAAGEIVEKIVEEVYTIYFDYAHMSNVMNAVSKPPFSVIAQRFTTTAELEVAVRQSEAEAALRQLKAQVAEVYLEEVEELESIEGFRLEHAYTR
jgi:uncharacterized YigZ family protein